MQLMKSFLFIVKNESFLRFRKTGALDVKYFKSQQLPQDDNSVFVSSINDSVAYGPFFVTKSEPKSYVGRDSLNILCEARGTISKIMINKSASPCLSLINVPIDNTIKKYSSISGCLELDGLLSMSMYDPKLDTFYVLFLSSNKSLMDYYQNLMDQYGIDHYSNNKDILYIRSPDLCNSCIKIDVDSYYGCREFVQGRMSPIIMAYKTKEMILRDTPPELTVDVCFNDLSDSSSIDKIDGIGIISFYNRFGDRQISGLSVRSHPFCHLISTNNVDSDNERQSVGGLEYYRMGATKVTLMYMFRISGYSVEDVDENIIKIMVDGQEHYILLVKDLNHLGDEYGLFDYIHHDDGYVMIINNDHDSYIKIVEIQLIENNIGLESDIVYVFQNLQNNGLIPLQPNLVGEMECKIRIIWDL